MEGIGISLPPVEAANRRLSSLIEALRPSHTSFSVTAEHMAAVLEEVLRAGEWLRDAIARNAEGRLAEELESYRLHLEDLQRLLPTVHTQLLTERSRLQAEKAHLEATASWARSTHEQSR